jgi:hypothetical protein
MSFFDDASLVMIPSGYKDQKVYSVKPTDGTGDLTFSRASSATRVASDGLIEKVRTNLILQSQTFENASWAKVGVGTGLAAVVTANAGAAPDGTTTADRIVFNTGAGTTSSDRSIFRQSVVITEGSNLSFYIKSNTGSSQSIGFHNGGQIDIVTATTSWQRFSVNVTAAVTFVGLENRGDNATAGTCDVLVWGAQLQNGDIATPYIATTTAAVSVGPVSGLPRLDYLGSTCPRLLLEPQRSNLALYSEQINTGFTASQGGTGLAPVITANTTISPDGYQNADTIVFDAGAGTTTSDQSALFQSFGGTTATYTCSFYAKTASGTAQIQVRIDGAAYEKFTITNQWQRFTLTRALTGTGNGIDIAIRRGLNEPMNASATIQLWGVQVELGAYATSYIPTLGASVTRVADSAVKTAITSLIGQTEGTLFTDLSEVNDLDFPEISIDDNTNNNRIVLTRSAVNGFWGIFTASAGTGVSGYGTTAGNSGKLALAYSAAGYVLYRNGVQVATASAALPVSLSAIRLNGRSTSDFFATKKVAQTLLFKTRLTNAQLAELTAL